MTDALGDHEPEDFATLFAREGAQRSLEVGQVVKGRILQVGAETVFVDVGGKGEALMDRAELEDEHGQLRLAVGDEIEATVVHTGDEVRLSYRLLQGVQARQRLAVAAETGLPVEGKVAAVIKGGYEVTVAGLRAFCPFSQMDTRRVDTPETLVGRVLEFRISRYGEQGRNIVLSRRALLEEQAARAAEETMKKVVAGAVLPGTVASLPHFGAFVDLGGVHGLVPLSEISYSRVGQPADHLHVGEAVTVKVLKVDEAAGKISLSLKALEGDPWAAVPSQLRERQIVRGRAARMTDFGVFVELLPGVDGLLHLTEIPRHRHAEMKQAAQGGAELVVLVSGIDLGKRRISLALAPEGATPGDRVESRIAVGALVTGTVERIEPFGVFVRLGPGQVGLIPNAEMGTVKGADHRKEFPPGTELKIAVLSIEDGGKRIRLSRAQALRMEEDAETKSYIQDSGRKGFGMTLGEALRQSRRK
ncbi:MAG TPA: S1 RNA-binding domain-containing protein [Methylomirabilota bacterium]|jgi:small subunit ribosomal protein S1|nr:S1 RNA-binding domain-containing protein [Methylomirabilota bacterium]